MLTQLSIRNFTLIEHLELELHDGMTVISGETGAGKSIILDALGLTLGDRADADMVRHQCSRADICANFDISRLDDARQWLQQQELDQDNECLLRRVVNRNGRSRGYINGHPVPLQTLRTLGERLIDIHGQHEHQSLLKKEQHLKLLDNFGHLGENSRQLQTRYHQWQRKAGELNRIRQQSEEQEAQIQLLRYQVEELEQLAPAEGEVEALEEEHKQLANAGQLLHAGDQVRQMITESETGNCHELLSQSLQQLGGFDLGGQRWQEIQEMLNSALIQIDEASSELAGYLSQVEVDPNRLNWVEERLSALYDVARKHQVEADQLATLYQRLSDKLSASTLSDEAIAQLEEEAEAARNDYMQAAEALSLQRRDASETLNTQVNQQLKNLGMSASHFVAKVDPQPAAANGLDAVEFLISTNPGQPPKPLHKVASGGELSRISLAIQVVTATTCATPVLAFDEVDVGIGGAIAEVVGRLLRDLGQHSQILCVTHQPQVASCGHHHYYVSKRISEHNDEEQSVSQIRPLDPQQRIQEIARMLGGIDITQRSLDHAEEMLTVN